ncbi:DUF1837 domain-containing protein [bacterium]|nr:DUF1837 domain-containing protein [bacterium]
MQLEKYKDFTVYKNDEKNIFIHIDISSDDFCKKLLMYFLNETKLLNYISNKTNIKFSGTKKDFVKLHKKINDFFDEENLEIDEHDLKKELENYIDWEEYSKDELLTLRRDKVGKIGEYIFHNILVDYFNSLCVIPKLNLVTNRNMSIYGIDVIFYNPTDNTLMFGESKVSKSLENGINLVNDSLKNYQHQIFEEYRAILSSDVINISNLPKELEKYIDTCIDFERFINEANIKTITIPIFIMHGLEFNVEEIFEKMNKLKKTTVLDLNIKYTIISLPIIDKNIFQSCLVEFLKERIDYYESMS